MIVRRRRWPIEEYHMRNYGDLDAVIILCAKQDPFFLFRLGRSHKFLWQIASNLWGADFSQLGPCTKKLEGPIEPFSLKLTLMLYPI